MSKEEIAFAVIISLIITACIVSIVVCAFGLRKTGRRLKKLKEMLYVMDYGSRDEVEEYFKEERREKKEQQRKEAEKVIESVKPLEYKEDV